MSPSARIFHADGVITGDAGALRDGAVVVDDGGAVLAVGVAPRRAPGARGVARHARARRGAAGAGERAHAPRAVGAPGARDGRAWLRELGGAAPRREGRVTTRRGPRGDRGGHRRARSRGDDRGRRGDELARGGAWARAAGHRRIDLPRGVLGAVRRATRGDGEGPRARKPRSGERVGAWPTTDPSPTPPAPHTLYTTHGDAVREALRARAGREPPGADDAAAPRGASTRRSGARSRPATAPWRRGSRRCASPSLRRRCPCSTSRSSSARSPPACPWST